MTEIPKLFQRRTTHLQATPMTLGEYHKMRGWPAPADPETPGYTFLVEPEYNVWQSKETFEAEWEPVKSAENKLTNAQVDAAISAWFMEIPAILPDSPRPEWRRRMREAIAAALGIGEAR
jgi:hypothetical protein